MVGIMNVGYLSVSNGLARQRLRTSLFFIVHYGGFWIGHGVFLFVLLMPEISKYAGPSTDTLIDTSQTIRYAFWGFVLSHALSFVIHVLKHSRSERLPPTYQMFTPYGRVFVMHIVILGGAFVAAKYSNILSILLLFVGLKILFEIGATFIGKNWRQSLEQKGHLE